ncbi:MAG: energy-coupling factor transporter transmembrane component T [Lachnospiraceae bacterium]|nr:energy-coupling factor transporter transmembrane component T [Lachnospiraceae bacterium]
MIRDITIGQYYMVDSPIHSLDPRLKLIATFVYVICLFIINDVYTYAFSMLALAGIIAVSKVPLKFIMRGIKSIIVIIIFTAIINVLTTKGTHVLYELGWFTVTLEGVYMATKMVVRLIMLIVSSSLLTLTTTPIQLTDGIEYLLKPFQKIGVPSHEIAMMMTIALRFIPTLLDETDKIMKAQQARGADFETGGLMEKAKSLVPILVPLFISAFRRADELAMAMEARCYHGGDNRTRMNVMALQKNDYYAMAVICGFVVCLIIIMLVM